MNEAHKGIAIVVFIGLLGVLVFLSVLQDAVASYKRKKKEKPLLWKPIYQDGPSGRDARWGTHLGNTVTVRGMGDEHLANTIQFLKHYRDHPGNDDMLPLFEAEVKLRELSDEFLSRAPFPYKDGAGNWIVWDFQTNAPKSIGRYDRQ